YISDSDRILSRVALGPVTPNDLVAMRYSLEQLPIIKKLLSEKNTPEIKKINNRIHQLDEHVTLIDKAIIENPPTTIR
ncbi:hypothetical protein NAI74_10320, partial [Francisella tularensis subsp. holarctica]|uniref:hypothetical protein n=1 Tax=Francisella tularensis TaxID=263 RepID=UPI002381A79A